MNFEYSISDFFLQFKTPFSIAHGTREGTDIVILKLVSGGVEAFGEASLPPYLPETKESVREFVVEFLNSIDGIDTGLENLLARLSGFRSDNFSAKACVNIALHNWYANKLNIPVWKLLGLKNSPLPDCTFTIGMDRRDVIEEKIHEAKDFKILKVKLGGDHDREIISNIRSLTDKAICVDVNQGWKDKEFALEMLYWLKGQNVLFVEQPLPKNNLQDLRWLHEQSPMPLIADESVQVFADIEKVKDSVDGINIKLMKCGGISEGLKMIHEARRLNLKVLIGSMSETGCGINAAAQLSSLADWVDLDGPLLTSNNPFDIVHYHEGKIVF